MKNDLVKRLREAAQAKHACGVDIGRSSECSFCDLLEEAADALTVKSRGMSTNNSDPKLPENVDSFIHVPTPDEARGCLVRFVNSHFHRGSKEREYARFSIPANVTRDDDLLLGAFIDDAEKTKAAYMELLYAVARKFPKETRHQTALKYIRQAEMSQQCEGAESGGSTLAAGLGGNLHAQ